MHVTAARTHTAIDRLLTQEKTANSDDAFLTSGHSAYSETDDTDAVPVSITLSQAAIDSVNGSTLQNSMASMQLALSRMDQIIQSGNSAAKADAATRIANLKAQMRLLLEMKALMSPKALAMALAQMARELAAAVSEYIQNGGTAANAAIGNAILSASLDTSNNPPASEDTTADQSAATDQDDSAIEQADQHGQGGSIVDSSNGATGQSTIGGKPRTSENEDDLFGADARNLADQMKGILNEIKNKKKKDGSSGGGDLQSAQSALDTVEQLTD